MKKSTIFSMKDCVAFLLYPILLLVFFYLIPVAMAAQAPIEGSQQVKNLSKQWQKYTPELGVFVIFKPQLVYGPYDTTLRLNSALLNQDRAGLFFSEKLSHYSNMKMSWPILDSKKAYETEPKLVNIELPDIYLVTGLSLDEALEMKGDYRDIIFVPNWQTKVQKPKKQNSDNPISPLGSDFVPNDSAYFLQRQAYERMLLNKVFSMQNDENQRGLAPQGPDVVVGVVDSPTSLLPDMVDGMFVNPYETANNSFDDDHDGVIDDVYGYNGLDNNGSVTNDLNGHGTGMNSLISARTNNLIGIAGVAGMSKRVKVLSLVACTPDGFFRGDAIIKCFSYVIANASRFNIRILNNSYSDSGEVSQLFLPLYSALDALNVLVIYGSGNQKENLDTFSGTQKSLARVVNNVLNVAGVDDFGNFQTSFSAYGPNTVYLAAPTSGQELTPSGFPASGNGTSDSSAYASGLAALVIERNPMMTAYELKMQLVLTALKFPNQESYVNKLGGYINSYAALTEHPFIPPKPISAPVISFTQPSFSLVKIVGKKQFQVKVDVIVKQNSSNLPVAINFDWLDNSPHTELFDTSATHTYSTKKGHSVIAYAFVVTQDGQVVKSASVSCQVVFQK